MVKTAVTLSGVLLDNPVIPASGTFGFGYEFAQWYDINCLGAISIKGTTREPRFGNPAPRIAETAGGMLNAVGLQNPGIDRVVAEELPKLREVYQKPILANISGFSLDEYVTCCAKADASPYTDLIEVNVSGEESKGGFSPDEIRVAVGELAELEGICVQGLMTMAPRGNKDVARRTFAGLRELRDELEAAHPDLNLPELSCGMSEDFEPALEEGSTLVRLGRVVFSPEFAVK